MEVYGKKCKNICGILHILLKEESRCIANLQLSIIPPKVNKVENEEHDDK